MQILPVIIAIIAGYLLGSIPFGLLITKATGGGDIREIGSGNIGATNVLRTGRKDIALITLVLDGAKAAAALLLVNHLFGAPYGYIAGALALIGHCFPVWLRFQGGKGVATYLGAVLAAAWPVGLITCGIWIATAVITKMSSLAALVAALVAPAIALLFGHYAAAIMAGVLTIVIFIRHKDNIDRLRAGTESKIGKKD